jgi:hypothetical protein
MTNTKDVQILRELARQVAEIAARPVQEERRGLWRRHNSLQPTRPLLYVRGGVAFNDILEPQLKCEDPFYRAHERHLRRMIFQDTVGDDFIIEPWITQRASYVTPEEGLWGVPVQRTPSTEEGGAWKCDPPLKEPEDIEKLLRPHHRIDEEATARNVEKLQEAVGDYLEVNVDRAPVYRVWHADISTDLGYLREIEQFMWDMVDRPEWLHELVGFLRDGVLTTHEEAEEAGDWRLANSENQAMPYSLELPDPEANSDPVDRDELWCLCAVQEMAQVGPDMHDEFVLQYQLPIIEKFGLVAYGCCEDLTNKIDMLRQVPNLRRIAVTPWADVARCAEQIGDDYVYSWRPSPANQVCVQFDPDYIRKTVREAMEATRGCHVDITLKDIQTLEGEPERLREWVQIVRDVTDRYAP